MGSESTETENYCECCTHIVASHVVTMAVSHGI